MFENLKSHLKCSSFAIRLHITTTHYYFGKNYAENYGEHDDK